MLQFICFYLLSIIEAIMFQYISCCSLSSYRVKKEDSYYSFNTSHVVVYLLDAFFMLFSENVSIHLMLQFIQIVPACHQSLICFNTSHVVVYRNLHVLQYFPADVSIHLMLQFIDVAYFHAEIGILFQYISCCSLSKRNISAV